MSSTSEPVLEPVRRPLRLGLLLDSTTVPAWVRRCVELAVAPAREADPVDGGPAGGAAPPLAELALVVVNASPPGRDEGLPARLWRRRHHLLYELYARLDRRLFPARPDPFARVSLEDLLEGVPTLRVEPERSRWSDRFHAADLKAIRGHHLDVVLRFGFRILRGGVLEVARHGVWSHHHDDNRVVRGGPPGFWEVMERHPATGSVLQVLSERLDAGRVIYRSWSPTHRRSILRNKAHVYWKSAPFVRRCLEALAATGDPAAGEAAREERAPAPPSHDRPLYRKPGNGRMAALLARRLPELAAGKVRDAVTRKQWFVAFRLTGEEDGAPPGELFRYTPLLPPPDRFWADPFPVTHGDGWVVLLEEYPFRRRRGHVAALEITRDGRWSPPRPVLERPYHLSYPFPFRWRGETFLLPETAANRTVELYRATSFPERWEPEAVLMEGVRAVDATLHEEDGRWWMFVNVAPEEVSHTHDELHLFHAPSPLGPWRPHRRNPIVSDARRARPAGRLFRWRGELYRPAQDCSHHYGYAINLQRVRRLDVHEYEEETVTRIEPHWHPGLLATHTWNACPGLAVVDGLRRIRRRWGG